MRKNLRPMSPFSASLCLATTFNKCTLQLCGCLWLTSAPVRRYDDLSVEDNIVLAAILFNKRGLHSREEVRSLVDHAIELLGLSFIRCSIVGSAEKKGISGGQKKRVSIAMEMVKEAAMFFLDEPTSGTVRCLKTFLESF